MDGVLVIDKPRGPTSHDVVRTVKRLIGARKVGHLGTLDPSATGVLPLVIDGATRHAARLAGYFKTYEFTLCLGVATDTDDSEGRVVSQSGAHVGVDDLNELLPRFIGRIRQRPPIFSAKRVGGSRSYELARQGRGVKLEEREVEINNLYITECCIPKVKMILECGSGTYVRSLCRDLGEALGCGAHAADIRRLKSGSYAIEDAVPLDDLMNQADLWKSRIIPL